MVGKIDDSTGATVSIPLLHERIHSGKTFVASFKTPDADPLADNGTLEFLIITGDIPLYFSFQSAGNDDVETAFFENTTVSNNGTMLSVVGLNRKRSLAPSAAVWRDPTITADGDQLSNLFTSWAIEEPIARDDINWVLKENTNYLVRVINRAGAVQPVSLVIQWYEL